jgi:hypothetical protein
MENLELRREDTTRLDSWRQDKNLSVTYFLVAMIDFREIGSKCGRGGRLPIATLRSYLEVARHINGRHLKILCTLRELTSLVHYLPTGNE